MGIADHWERRPAAAVNDLDLSINYRFYKKVSIRRKPESRVPDENRDPVYEIVPPGEPGDEIWMPPYQVRGRLLKSGMTD